MRSLAQFVITAPAPSPWEQYRAGERTSWAEAALPPGIDSCEEWAARLVAGQSGLPFPARTHPCFPALQAAATGAERPQGSAPVAANWLDRLGQNLVDLVRATGRTIGEGVGSAVGAGATAAAPDWSGVGRVLLFAGLGLGALYLIGPMLAGKRR